MKKTFTIILMILTAFCLSCCTKEPPTVNTELSAAFTVTQDDTDYAGSLHLSGGALHIEMTAPYTVAGLCFDYDDEGQRIAKDELSTQAGSDYLPAGAIPEVLHNTLAYLPQATYTDTENEADHFTLPTPYGNAELTARDGVPTALYDPHTNLRFTFR